MQKAVIGVCRGVCVIPPLYLFIPLYLREEQKKQAASVERYCLLVLYIYSVPDCLYRLPATKRTFSFCRYSLANSTHGIEIKSIRSPECTTRSQFSSCFYNPMIATACPALSDSAIFLSSTATSPMYSLPLCVML